MGGKKICGDWTKKLKLLRYTTASKSTQVILKFESDFSHHFPGFKVKVTVEKGKQYFASAFMPTLCRFPFKYLYGDALTLSLK